MQYSTAEEKDLDDIIQLKNKVKQRVRKENLPIWLGDYPTDEILREDVLRKEGRIVRRKNKVITFAAFFHSDVEYPEDTFSMPDLQSFGRLMVMDEFVGKHIGLFLVEHMIAEAMAMKVNGMGIMVDASNLRAIRLYEKIGFQWEGQKNVYDTRLETYLLLFKV